MPTPKDLEAFLVASQMREIQRSEAHNEKVRALELKKLEAEYRDAEFRAAITRELWVKDTTGQKNELTVSELRRLAKSVTVGAMAN